MRAGSDLLATFPGCEEAANVLIFSNSDDGTFNHQTNVWFMRCGNVTIDRRPRRAEASADADVTSNIIIGAANASFNKVNALPLQHDAGERQPSVAGRARWGRPTGRCPADR